MKRISLLIIMWFRNHKVWFEFLTKQKGILSTYIALLYNVVGVWALYKNWTLRTHLQKTKFSFMPVLHLPCTGTFKKHSQHFYARTPAAQVLGMYLRTQMWSSAKTKMFLLHFCEFIFFLLLFGKFCITLNCSMFSNSQLKQQTWCDLFKGFFA